MKPNQTNIIKSLYKSADYEQKEKIKECFPEVFELPETGWLKSISGCIYFRTGKDSAYGANTCKDWVVWNHRVNFVKEPQNWHPATESEVKEMLIAEAKRRGVWDCPIVDKYGERKIRIVQEVFSLPLNQLWSQYGLVFDNGKWATPIEKPPSEKEDFETLYKKLKTKVTFSNEVILEIDGKRIKITLID